MAPEPNLQLHKFHTSMPTCSDKLCFGFEEAYKGNNDCCCFTLQVKYFPTFPPNTNAGLRTDKRLNAPQAKHVGKVVIDLHSQPTQTAGGTILITGGLGALGSLVATWLARQSSATRLVLVGRSGRFDAATASPQLRQLLNGSLGCEVTVSACDASRAADVVLLGRPGSGSPAAAGCLPLQVHCSIRSQTQQFTQMTNSS